LRRPDHNGQRAYAVYPKIFKNHEKLPLDEYGTPPYLEYPVVRDSAYEEYILNDESQIHRPFRLRAIIEAATAKVVALLVHKRKGDPTKTASQWQ
jgi:hypothetical protein